MTLGTGCGGDRVVDPVLDREDVLHPRDVLGMGPRRDHPALLQMMTKFRFLSGLRPWVVHVRDIARRARWASPANSGRFTRPRSRPEPTDLTTPATRTTQPDTRITATVQDQEGPCNINHPVACQLPRSTSFRNQCVPPQQCVSGPSQRQLTTCRASRRPRPEERRRSVERRPERHRGHAAKREQAPAMT